MSSSGPPDLFRTLHADDRWLRDLARRLLRDASLAEDVAQQTWLSVLRSPPSAGLNRGFLAAALRHVIAKVGRGEARRTALERAGAMAEESPLKAVVEQLELRRFILVAVLELEEIYRDVILLRFYQDLSAAEIARRQGVPLATVKTRLARAQERLAGRLVAYGDDQRSHWLGALVAIAEPGVPALSSMVLAKLAGGISMAVKSTVTVAAVITIAVVAGMILFDQRSPPAASSIGGDAPRGPDLALVGPQPDGLTPRVAPAEARRAESAVDPQSVAPVAQAAGPHAITGLVFDALGEPSPARVCLCFTPGKSEDAARLAPCEALADADGRFRFELPLPVAGRITAAARDVATLYEGTVERGPQSADPVVVLAPGVHLGGQVIDPDGRPIAAARITIAVAEVRQRIPVSLEQSSRVAFAVQSDAAGRFHFADAVPSGELARLVLSAPGFLADSRPVQTVDDLALTLVLERPSSRADNRVRGQVIDLHGAPVAGAQVVVGHAAERTDDRGLFDLDATRAGKATVLRAAAAGLQPAALAWPIDPPLDFVVLQLGPPALTIAGKVRRADGSPAAHVAVQPADGDVLGATAQPEGRIRLLEEQIGGYDHGVTTDAMGDFVLPGLLPRAYSLRVFEEQTGVVFRTAPIEAGNHAAIIDLPADLTVDELPGRVLDDAGQPVAGAMVSITVTRHEVRYLGDTFSSQSSGIGRVTTDAEGRFRLRHVPRAEALVHVTGQSLIDRLVRLPEVLPEELRIAVDRRRFLRIELSASDPADRFTVVDAQAKVLMMRMEEADSIEESFTFALSEGRSGVIAVPSGAAFVVLYRDDAELRRVPIAFDDSGLATIR